MSKPALFRALQSRNYRLFFIGQSISLIGNWMTSTVNAWLAYELSRDPAVVGMVLFCGMIPVLLFSPMAGVLGDRVDRRRLFFVLQIACLLYSSALATVTLTGHVSVAWLLSLALVRGLVNSVEFPTRQALIVELLEDRQHLNSAIALNSSMFNIARLTGPMIAGAIIATAGSGICYLLDALSVTPVLVGLLAMKLPRRIPETKTRAHPWHELREGLRYVTAEPRLRRPLLLVACTAVAGFSSTILAPAYARDILGGDARTLGFMQAGVGLGALASALYLGSWSDVSKLPRLIRMGAWCVTGGHIIVALSRLLPITLVGLVTCGIGTVFIMAGCNTLIQSRVDDTKRGRVMGLFSMCQGMFPIGSLLIGFLARATTPPIATLVAAGAMTLIALIFSPRNRPPQPAG